MAEVSVVLPAYNESETAAETVEAVLAAFEGSDHTYEVILVDDGSSDDTAELAAKAGARIIRHPCNIGYGNAILTGVRGAEHSLIALADADGSYPVQELPALVSELSSRRLDMLIAARKGKHYSGPIPKRVARRAFKFLAEFVVGQRIPDINSGLRVMRRSMVMEFAPFLCGGFSFTTTVTMIAMLTNRFVDFRAVQYHARQGESKIRYYRDTLRTAQLLIMTILLFNPIKLFILAAGLVLATGLVVSLLCLQFPGITVPVAVFGGFFLTACILLGLGFVAEQRRASISLPHQRHERAPRERSHQYGRVPQSTGKSQ